MQKFYDGVKCNQRTLKTNCRGSSLIDWCPKNFSCRLFIEPYGDTLQQVWSATNRDTNWRWPLASKQHQYPNPCQQYQEFPSSLPSKYYPGLMLLNFSILMKACAANMVQLPTKACEKVNNSAQFLIPTQKLFRRLMCLRKKMFHIFDDAYIWQLCEVLSFRLFSLLSFSLFSYFFPLLSFSILSLFVILFFGFSVPKCLFFFHIILFTSHLHYFLKFYVLFFNWLLSFSNSVYYDISLFLAPIM